MKETVAIYKAVSASDPLAREEEEVHEMNYDLLHTISHDRILWILTNSGGKMERSTLRRRGHEATDLEPILGKLAREGRDQDNRRSGIINIMNRYFNF